MAKKTSFKSAEIVSTAEGRQYHIGLAPGEVASNIILCGDPNRAHVVAKHFEEKGEPVCSREYVTITGKYKGIPISVMATGIGSDNMEIAVVELCQIVENPTMIRLGTSSSLQTDIAIGDFIIASGGVRLENVSSAYVVDGYPAVTDYEVMLGILEAAKLKKVNYHVGLTGSAPGFYASQGRDVPGFPPYRGEVDLVIAKMNVKNLEMEISCLYTLANVKGFRAGGICFAVGNRQHNTFMDKEEILETQESLVKIGLDAFTFIAKIDAAKGSARYWTPSMGLK